MGTVAGEGSRWGTNTIGKGVEFGLHGWLATVWNREGKERAILNRPL